MFFLTYVAFIVCQFTCFVCFLQSKNYQDAKFVVSFLENANQPTLGQDSLWTAEVTL